MMWLKNALETVYKNEGFWAALVLALAIGVAIYFFGQDIFNWLS
jgi:hypothetical protein